MININMHCDSRKAIGGKDSGPLFRILSDEGPTLKTLDFLNRQSFYMSIFISDEHCLYAADYIYFTTCTRTQMAEQRLS